MFNLNQFNYGDSKIIGAGLVVIGAGIGIGRIGGSNGNIARQPEATGKIQTAVLLPLSN